MKILHQIAQFELCFSTSFKFTSSTLYSVTFSNSNVLETIEKLQTLRHNVENEISTGKHVGAPINTGDVDIVLSTLERIVEHYKTINNIQSLPKRLKLYVMFPEIQTSEAIDLKEIAKEVVKEVLSPVQPEKLTKKQKIEQGAAVKSAERKLSMLKKQERKKP
jgi:hypothetical protein